MWSYVIMYFSISNSIYIVSNIFSFHFSFNQYYKCYYADSLDGNLPCADGGRNEEAN